jgi:hypothetical protein
VSPRRLPAGRSAGAPAEDLEGQLVDLLALRAAAVEAAPGDIDALIGRARTRRRKRRATGLLVTAVLPVAVCGVALRRAHQPDAPADHLSVAAPLAGPPERVVSQWATTPLRLGLDLAGAAVIAARDADWSAGPLPPAGAPGIVQRWRPSADRFEGPAVLLAVGAPEATPGSSLPGPPPGGTEKQYATGGDTTTARWTRPDGRAVHVLAHGLPPAVARAMIEGLLPEADGRYTATDLPQGLTEVLSLTGAPVRSDQTALEYRLADGSTARIDVGLGDEQTLEASLPMNQFLRTVEVRGHRVAVSADAALWYEPENDAVVTLTRTGGPVEPLLAHIAELSEAQFQTYVGRGPTPVPPG